MTGILEFVVSMQWISFVTIESKVSIFCYFHMKILYEQFPWRQIKYRCTWSLVWIYYPKPRNVLICKNKSKKKLCLALWDKFTMEWNSEHFTWRLFCLPESISLGILKISWRNFFPLLVNNMFSRVLVSIFFLFGNIVVFWKFSLKFYPFWGVCFFLICPQKTWQWA